MNSEILKIILRALKAEDIWSLHKWINDPEVIKFTNHFLPISEMEQKQWFESLSNTYDQYIFGIEIIETNALIGTCGLYEVNQINRNAELRLKIGEKSEWGKGFGKMAVDQLLDFGFKDLNLHRIWLKVLEDNSSAITIYKKTGFIIEGTLKDDIFIRGNYKNVLIMGKVL